MSEQVQSRSETPDVVYGRLLETVHINGYTAARACSELDWLLAEDRWKQCGGGFDDFGKFLSAIDISKFRLAAEDRKALAKKLHALEASQRAIGKALGVSHTTIQGDLRDGKKLPNAKEQSRDSAQENMHSGNNLPVVLAPFQSDGAAVATLAEKNQEKIEKRKSNAAKRAAIAAEPVAVPVGTYNCIVIDPPWPMEKIEREVRPNQIGFDYPTMSEDDLDAFKLPEMAADDCHLFCWTTHKFLPMALRLIEVWGFRYVCTFVWRKSGGFQPIGLPQYNCEFALYARTGSPIFIDTKAFFCCFDGERREHSRKPIEFYDFVRRVTAEPRLDVFSRERHDGFDQYGNEADKFEGVA